MTYFFKEIPMTSIADRAVIIQTSSESVPSTPCWFGEVVLMAAHLRKHDILTKIAERVRFARRRFGRYEVIDFLAVLLGYAISGERTLEAFYQTELPWAEPFMALFNREKLPSRSALSRFLAVFTLEAVEAVRALFVEDLLARPLAQEQQRGELLDRAGGQWEVFDIDGTREAARQRALPKTEDLPAAQRRLDEVCAAGYTGRKRGDASVPVPSFRKLTALSGSAVSETEAMGSTARNWHTRWGSSVAISRHSASLKHMLCCDWTVSTELGPSLQIWMASAS
jgi:hypothetical protein